MIDPAPSSPASQLATEQSFQQARVHHQAGRLAEAEDLYRAILRAEPNHAGANHNLGVLALQTKRSAAALMHLKAALEIDPHLSQHWLSYIAALIHAGTKDTARQVFEEAHRQGVRGQGMEQLKIALDGATQPPDRPSQQDVQQVLQWFAAGRNEEVVSIAQAMTVRFPQASFGWKILGPALMRLGRVSEALEPMLKAVALSPLDANTHHNLSNTLKALGRLDEAAASCRRAIELKPDLVEAHLNLGSILFQQARYDEAIACCRQALQLKPESPIAHFNLGKALHQRGQIDAAVASYRQALEIKPDFAEALATLGTTLHEQAHHEEAAAIHRRAAELRPDRPRYGIQARLWLPIIPPNADAISRAHARYESGIAALMQAPGTLDDAEGPPEVAAFYLAYQNSSNAELTQATSRLFRAKWPDLAFVSSELSHRLPPAIRGERIRVGFVSSFFFGHTIGKLYQGFIRHLDRRRFEVLIVHMPESKRDIVSRALDAAADKSLTLPPGLRRQQHILEAENLDVLFYPDIGMTGSTYFLAHSRLAPVQAVGWGHPATTGISTIDYFLSAVSIEPEGADAHYTERLVRLRRLPSFYEPFVPVQLRSRAELNLPEHGILYGCPQSLFKFHPDFDRVLAEIAEIDGEGHIVVLEPAHSAWQAQLKARWEKEAPVLLDRVLFLPRLGLPDFMALMAQLDLLLDPLHFGSGNTLYEAMAFGTPIVTWPGRFMRGRIVAGAYQQMGVTGAPVAPSIEAYASLTLKLGRDTERRHHLKQQLKQAAHQELFSDAGAVREFEQFLEAAVAAAASGGKLPNGWIPPSP